jgi:hypothetical protein
MGAAAGIASSLGGKGGGGLSAPSSAGSTAGPSQSGATGGTVNFGAVNIGSNPLLGGSSLTTWLLIGGLALFLLRYGRKFLQ